MFEIGPAPVACYAQTNRQEALETGDFLPHAAPAVSQTMVSWPKARPVCLAVRRGTRCWSSTTARSLRRAGPSACAVIPCTRNQVCVGRGVNSQAAYPPLPRLLGDIGPECEAKSLTWSASWQTWNDPFTVWFRRRLFHEWQTQCIAAFVRTMENDVRPVASTGDPSVARMVETLFSPC